MLTLYDEFAGWGGSSQGFAAVPGVELLLAANHDELAVDVHAMNFPTAEHYCGDVAKEDIARFPCRPTTRTGVGCPPRQTRLRSSVGGGSAAGSPTVAGPARSCWICKRRSFSRSPTSTGRSPATSTGSCSSPDHSPVFHGSA